LYISQFVLQQKMDSIGNKLLEKNVVLPKEHDLLYILCRKCGESKPQTDFAKDKRIKSGYKSTCKQCENIRQKNRKKS
jgi:hypothetical protein